MLDHRLAERLAEIEAPIEDGGVDLATLPVMPERDIPDPFAVAPKPTI